MRVFFLFNYSERVSEKTCQFLLEHQECTRENIFEIGVRDDDKKEQSYEYLKSFLDTKYEPIEINRFTKHIFTIYLTDEEVAILKLLGNCVDVMY